MALTFRAFYRNCLYLHKPVRCNVQKNFPLRILTSGLCHKTPFTQNIQKVKQLDSCQLIVRQCSKQSSNVEKPPENVNPKKPGLVQRFKEMYRDYWYVLLPVHGVTSAIWFGGFYYTVQSGVDVIGLLEWAGISDRLIEPLKDSKAGYFALAFACYKLATPLRYAVTIGGTTVAIKKLTSLGWIRPVPSRERMREMLQEKKDNLQDRFQESKQHYQDQMKEKRTQVMGQMKEKGSHVMDEMKRYKSEMRDLKNRIKKM